MKVSGFMEPSGGEAYPRKVDLSCESLEKRLFRRYPADRVLIRPSTSGEKGPDGKAYTHVLVRGRSVKRRDRWYFFGSDFGLEPGGAYAGAIARRVMAELRA